MKAVPFLVLLALPAQAAPLNDAIRAEMAKRHIPGLSVAVLKDGKTIAMKNYGVSNLETQTPTTSQTVYKIASLSKAFIADAILSLAQDGKLALDDRAAKYLTDAP
ncbi:MAG TPA: serine hydrolase domain-containing protein, partial [Rhizomicrobium sp.]|nr:serine hydrolase domain-containing protein [Rhizomicrobium sp.]